MVTTRPTVSDSDVVSVQNCCKLGENVAGKVDYDKELVIDCGDTLILRYYEGIVYLYSFTFRQLSHLYIDGSYSWNHTGENFEYGGSRIYFEGTELKTNELYRIVNDGEPNAEYYMEGKQVTKKELLKNTGVVLTVVVSATILVWALDSVLSGALNLILK